MLKGIRRISGCLRAQGCRLRSRRGESWPGAQVAPHNAGDLHHRGVLIHGPRVGASCGSPGVSWSVSCWNQ